MKKIIYLILLLTCHLWSTQSWGKISVGITSGVENTPSPYVTVTMVDLDNVPASTRARKVRVKFKLQYIYVNINNQYRFIERHFDRDLRYYVGTTTEFRVYLDPPDIFLVARLAGMGYSRDWNPSMRIEVLDHGRNAASHLGYEVDDEHRMYDDGVAVIPLDINPWNNAANLNDDNVDRRIIPNNPRNPNNPNNTDGNAGDDHSDHFSESTAAALDYFLDDSSSSRSSSSFREEHLRHLGKHKYTTYRISEGTRNDNWQKTLIRFNTGAFKAGALMEHSFRLVYEYNYVHPTTKDTRQIVMTKMVNAYIATDRIVEGTVYAPFPPPEFSQWLANKGYLASIKVTLESPHMLPAPPSSGVYHDGTSTKFTDANNFDNHYGHYFDRVCGWFGYHDHVPYVEKNDLILEPGSAKMRSQTVFKN